MKRVVIAEDDRSVATLVARVMRSIGYDPIICSDGQRALFAIEDNPDTRLLITDVQMPNMDGRDLVQALRDSEAFRDLPVIITSAVVGVAEITHLLDYGNAYFLCKPVDVGDLKRHARSMVERGKVSQAPV
jgi:DNA-binding response OmpR family regulator